MEFKLLASDHGRIKKLIVQSTAEGDTADVMVLNNHKVLIATLLNKSPDMEIIIFSQKNFDVEISFVSANYWVDLKQFIEGGEIESKRVQLLHPNFDMRHFLTEYREAGLVGQVTDASYLFATIQDPFLVTSNGQGTTALLEPYYCWSSPRDLEETSASEDSLLSKFIPEMLSSMTSTVSRATPWYFQGGNILGSSNFALIGEDIVAKNLIHYREDLTGRGQTFTDEIGKALGVDHVIFPGCDVIDESAVDFPLQPEKLFHLDLWLTLAGVSDDGRHRVFVARIYEYDERRKDWIPVSSSDPDQKYLDAAAARLTAYSKDGLEFKVVPLPLLKFEKKLLSYNNCLVEVEPGVRRVFLPVFARYLNEEGHPATEAALRRGDELAFAAWDSEVFEVIPVDWGMRDLARTKAGLHCKVLVLERGSI